MERLEPIVQPKREPRPLDPEEVSKIFKVIPASNVRDRALFTLLYETGIRVGEALGLQCSDVQITQDDEKIRVFGKGQRERTVMLTAAPQSIRLLRRHLKQNHLYFPKEGALCPQFLLFAPFLHAHHSARYTR